MIEEKYIDSDHLIGRLEKMNGAIADYAKAKADRVYIEQFRKSKKAILMKKAPMECKTDKLRESYAYSHQEYLDLLVGLKAAVEVEEKCRFALEALKLEVEVWRTIQCNQRFQQDRV